MRAYPQVRLPAKYSAVLGLLLVRSERVISEGSSCEYSESEDEVSRSHIRPHSNKGVRCPIHGEFLKIGVC